MKTSPTNSDTKIRNDALRLLYATMLRELPLESVKKFWCGHPISDGGVVLKDADLLKHVWQENKSSDISYVLGVFNAVEPFLIESGESTDAFVNSFINGLNKGAVVSVSALLGILAPFLKFLFNSDDLRYFGLKNVIPYVCQKMMPSMLAAVVKHEKKSNQNTTVFMLCLDRTFQKKIPYHDADLFIARPLQYSPTRLGLPAFESVAMISDPRPLEAVVDPHHIVRRSDKVYIKGNLCGTATTFSGFCTRNRISLNGHHIPNRPVVEVTCDYKCPIRKRVVLHRGTVYGAPVHLYRIKYRSNVRPSEQFMSPLIHEGLSEKSEAWQQVHDRHARLVADLERKIVFVYQSASETVSVNGRRLVKSAPAGILRRILREHVIGGKTEFANSDFTTDSRGRHVEIAENFSLRLQRLSNVLAEKVPEVRLVRAGRGLFKLHAPCRVELKEE
ncbi:MAG TPA: hypothetical protein VLX68_07220 [Chitinivibrionales bacterium]|nr:hypothetical protein [Chitinivibrionales bacterium]